LRLTALETNPAQLPKATLTNTYSRGKGSEILVIADKNSAVQFGDSSNERIRCVRRNTVAQEDYLVASASKNASHRIWNTIIDEKSDAKPLNHQAAALASSCFKAASTSRGVKSGYSAII
jgi:hypothetical protein